MEANGIVVSISPLVPFSETFINVFLDDVTISKLAINIDSKLSYHDLSSPFYRCCCFCCYCCCCCCRFILHRLIEYTVLLYTVKLYEKTDQNRWLPIKNLSVFELSFLFQAYPLIFVCSLGRRNSLLQRKAMRLFGAHLWNLIVKSDRNDYRSTIAEKLNWTIKLVVCTGHLIWSFKLVVYTGYLHWILGGHRLKWKRWSYLC